MRLRQASASSGAVCVLVFETGETLPDGLLSFARLHRVGAAEVQGIGAFASATVGYFDAATHDYVKIPIAEQVEVLGLSGNISTFEGGPRVHVHVLLGRRDGTVLGGHLIEARVHPTLEIFARVLSFPIERRKDEASGLPLIDLGA